MADIVEHAFFVIFVTFALKALSTFVRGS